MTVSGPHRHPFVAPFAFYLGMFNISFPYRGCERAFG